MGAAWAWPAVPVASTSTAYYRRRQHAGRVHGLACFTGRRHCYSHPDRHQLDRIAPHHQHPVQFTAATTILATFLGRGRFMHANHADFSPAIRSSKFPRHIQSALKCRAAIRLAPASPLPLPSPRSSHSVVISMLPKFYIEFIYSKLT